MTLARVSDGIYSDGVAHRTIRASSLIFDCDGVLIDVRKSYDLAIIKTARHILTGVIGMDSPLGVDSGMVEGFKATGGFNDEVDLAYAAILCIAVANSTKRDPKTLIHDAISHADSTGITSVESFLATMHDISPLKELLGYPHTGRANPVSSTFDQLFYGPILYERLFSKQSQFKEPGLVERDEVILDDMLLDFMVPKYRVGLVTGRGLESVRHSLGPMLDRFELDHSFFLEDEPRSLAKPNPKPLADCISGLGGPALYLGDSMEDLIMAKAARSLGHDVEFCGIVGTSRNPAGRLGLFGRNGATLALDSVRLLPKLLNPEPAVPNP